MNRQELVAYVRSQSALMGNSLFDWSDDEVFNLGTCNWCLKWNGE